MVRTPEYPGVLEQPFSARAGLGLNSLQAKLLCEALLAGLYTRPTLDCTYISFAERATHSMTWGSPPPETPGGRGNIELPRARPART